MAITAVLFFMTVAANCGGKGMADSSSIKLEADKLYEFLSADELHPLNLENGLKKFSEAGKNELVARLARTLSPAPKGFLLGRLHFIRSDANKADMAEAYILNLRSPDAMARLASLNGLAELKHPDLERLALVSLRDDDDAVLYAACDILLPKSKQDAGVRALLQGLQAMHKDNPAYYSSQSLLEANGFGKTP